MTEVHNCRPCIGKLTSLGEFVEDTIQLAEKLDFLVPFVLREILQKAESPPPLGYKLSVLAKASTAQKTSKPNAYRRKSPKSPGPKSPGPKSPFVSPFQKGAFVTEVSPNHNLLLNKYPIAKPHVLVTTKEYELQTEVLTLQDIESSLLVATELEGVAFFNSGPDAGSSQSHRHLQVIPTTDSCGTSLPICSWISQATAVPDAEYFQFTFLNHRHRLYLPEEKEGFTADFLYRRYLEFMKEEMVHEQAKAYNLLFTKKFFLLVPRSRQNVMAENGVSLGTNALGWAGHLICWSTIQTDAVEKIGGIFSLLDKLGVPLDTR